MDWWETMVRDCIRAQVVLCVGLFIFNLLYVNEVSLVDKQDNSIKVVEIQKPVMSKKG